MSGQDSFLRRRARLGFSLTELMVVLAVASILLGLAVPAFGNLIQREKTTSAVNDFLAAINLTRSEAIHRGRRIDLVPAEGGWKNGWVVFADENDNQKPDAGEEVIFRHEALAAEMSVLAIFPYDSATEYLAYTGSGRTRKNGSGDQPMFGSFRFRFHDQRRNIVINMLGRPYVCVPPANAESC